MTFAVFTSTWLSDFPHVIKIEILVNYSQSTSKLQLKQYISTVQNYTFISLIINKSVTTQNLWFFQKKRLKILKCYNFLWLQRRYNCSPAASFANCVTTLYLLKVHLQTFLSIPITQKNAQILNCDTLVANGRYILFKELHFRLPSYVESL